MFELFLAIMLALACPSHTHKNDHKDGTTLTVQDDTGGDDGRVPPVPPGHGG